MRIEEDVKLDFCDVLIKPKRSELASRSNVCLNRDYVFKNGNTWSGIPIFAANLDTVGTFEIAVALANSKMNTCLHKYYSENQYIDFYTKHKFTNISYYSWYTLGILESDFEKFDRVYQGCDKSIKHVCIDVANGYSSYFVERIKLFIKKYPDLTLMAGNIATPEMAQELIFNGVDIAKLGIGPGAFCVTRKVTGCGYPQLSSIIECADIAHGLNGHVCSDGGCQTTGDICKAFGAGADFVMLGGLFAGCAECEGEWIVDEDGNRFLKCYGMSSKEAMDKYHGGVAEHRAPEGKVALIPYKGSIVNVIQDILGGMRSACTYVGATKLKDLSKCTTFVKVNRTHNQIFGN